jgi:hypothetical protein
MIFTVTREVSDELLSRTPLKIAVSQAKYLGEISGVELTNEIIRKIENIRGMSVEVDKKEIVSKAVREFATYLANNGVDGAELYDHVIDFLSK